MAEKKKRIQIRRRAGIFQIWNKINGKSFIYHSYMRFHSTFYNHRQRLRWNNHWNKELQKDWLYFHEHNFEFNILEENVEKKDLIKRKQYWLDRSEAYKEDLGYNESPIAKPNRSTVLDGGWLIQFPSGLTVHAPTMRGFVDAWPEYNLSRKNLRRLADDPKTRHTHHGFKCQRVYPREGVVYTEDLTC